MNLLVTLGAPGWPIDPTTGEPVGSFDQQTGTFMHELGHNLGLTHGGDNDAINCKPNYLSIMNYLFQFPMFVANRPLDYSRSALPTLDKQNLNESNGIGQSTPPGLTTIYGPVGIGVREGPLFATAGSPVDWNFNGKFNDTDVKSDINAGLAPPDCGTPGPGGLNGVLNGFNDWSAITYIVPLQQVQQLKIAQQTSPPERELTINDVRQSRIDLFDGIIDAIDRAASGQKVAFKEFAFEIQNLIAALKTEEPTPTNASPVATNVDNNTTASTTITNIPSVAKISSLSPAVAKSLKPTGGASEVGSIDTIHIAQLLKTDQLPAAIGELSNLLDHAITLSSHQSHEQKHPQHQQQHQQHHHHKQIK